MQALRLTAFAIAALTFSACSTTSTPTSQAEIDQANLPVAPPAPPPVSEPKAASEVLAMDQAAAAGAVANVQAQRRMEEYARVRSPIASKMMATSPSVGFAYLPAPIPQPQDRENYADVADNPVLRAAEQPVSTFSIDVDTGSYSNVRRFLNQGQLPPTDAVRVEELINYFTLKDAPAKSLDTPFAVHTEVATTPWNSKTKLLRVGIKGYAPTGPVPPSNLVFLVDVSGSMNSPDKLPLVQSSLKLLTRQLTAKDRISLVTYAGATAVVLEPTPGDQRATIEQAIDRLTSGGGTAGGAGIQMAYQQAEKGFIKGGNNRILLATDGDFNVGVTRFETLTDMVKEKRKTGIALTTLGFGTGNYNEHLMEQLADVGDGNYSYIDSLQEAQKVLVAQRSATLLTIARDVKIQVEFNPAVVAEYRLIGYENRALKREDFSNDQVDAGDIGAGHSVTALYEVALAGEGGERNEPLRYSTEAKPVGKGSEMAFVRLRYKRPAQDASRLIEQPVRASSAVPFAQASDALRLTAAVAAFGQKLKGGTYTGDFGYEQIAALAKSARAADDSESVGEFVKLVGLAQGLSASAPATVSASE
ncbi:MAG: VWA domain-containing protein [Stagnimonas sp.]|nr:VWA domain-containing protein [Stagnimonas sp.]